MRPVRVMIAEDESFASHYLRILLSKYPNIQMVAIAHDGREAMHHECHIGLLGMCYQILVHHDWHVK